MAPGWKWERRLWGDGYRRVAGVDEAGRGPLAGPVVAAAVVLPFPCHLPGLNDSKLLTAKERDRLYDLILEEALDWAVGRETARAIDRDNILQASLRAMGRAVRGLAHPPDFLLVDGRQRVPLPLPQETLVGGDRLSPSVAAASILAKVTRDRLMRDYDRRYPGYGFASHKGYPTRAHLFALSRLGPCPIHRLSFRPLQDHRPLLERWPHEGGPSKAPASSNSVAKDSAKWGPI